MAKTLRERITEATSQVAPNMNPQPYEAPPKVEEEIPDISDAIGDLSARRKVKQLVIQHAEIGVQEKELRKAKLPITNAIKGYLTDWQVGKMQCEQFRVNFYSVPRSTIKKDKLVVALTSIGLLPAEINRIITTCTDVSNVATLRIGLPGDREED